LIDRINVLIAENAELKERVASARGQMGQPPKTPDNSSFAAEPGSQGFGGSGEQAERQAAQGIDRDCILIRPARSMCGRRIVPHWLPTFPPCSDRGQSVTIASATEIKPD